jgi:parallel beta-helix repeat protein
MEVQSLFPEGGQEGSRSCSETWMPALPKPDVTKWYVGPEVSVSLIAFLLAASMYSAILHAQTSPSPQAAVPATSAPGSDIGDRVNHALKTCALQCTVYIPPGNYSFSVSIHLELNPFGTYKLSGDPGAVLSYTGSGDAITTSIGSQAGSSQLLIEGFQLRGNPHAASGIHLMPTNRISVRNMVIIGFSGGDGILVEGTNSSNIYDNLIANNKNGIRLIPTLCGNVHPIRCGPSVDGLVPYAANAIHVTDNQITSNSAWAIFEDTVSIGHGLTEAMNNLYMGNNFEANAGAIYLTRSRGTVIEANYFEGSYLEVVLGIANGGGGYRAFGPVVRDNYFTTLTGTPYNIEIRNADSALIEGNSELIASAGPKNCFVNMVGATRTWIGKNAIYQKNAYCFNGVPGTPPAGDGSYFFGQR